MIKRILAAGFAAVAIALAAGSDPKPAVALTCAQALKMPESGHRNFWENMIFAVQAHVHMPNYHWRHQTGTSYDYSWGYWTAQYETDYYATICDPWPSS